MKTIFAILALTFPAVTQVALFSISGTATVSLVTEGDIGTQFSIGSSFPYEIIFDEAAPDLELGAGQSYSAVETIEIAGESQLDLVTTILNIEAFNSNSNLAFSIISTGNLGGDNTTISADFFRPVGESNPVNFQLTDIGTLALSDLSEPLSQIILFAGGAGAIAANPDTIIIRPVPEPTTPALILLGTLALLRRRAR